MHGFGLAAAAAVVAVAIGASLLNRPDQNTGPAASPSSSVSPSPSGSVGPSLPPGVTTIDMGAETWALAVDDQSVWVQVGEAGVNRIDKAANRATGIRVEEMPQHAVRGLRASGRSTSAPESCG